MLKIKRLYEKPEKGDGFRILIDRLWPRGVSKNSAKINLWLKEISPSGELRKWFSHEPERWGGFQKKYKSELKKKTDLLNRIKQIDEEKGVVTLVYSTKDEKHNNAIVLKNLLGR